MLPGALGQPIRLCLGQGSTDCKNSKPEPVHLAGKPTLRHYLLPHVDGARIYVSDRVLFQGGLAVISPNLRSDIKNLRDVPTQ